MTPDQPLNLVAYAPLPEGEGLPKVSFSLFNFEETLRRLKAAIEAEEVWLIHEIDPQLLLLRGGYSILPTRQLLFFHPRYLARLLEGDPSGLIEAPLRLVVWASPDGRVRLRYPEVAKAFSRYPALEALGHELDSLCQRVVASVSRCD